MDCGIKYNGRNMVSIVIPTLSTIPKLEKYVSVLSYYRAVNEVIVVVNRSGEDFDQNTLHWRFLGKNKGFTGACNAGARIAKGEHLLFLNDDCEMAEGALETMVAFLEKNENIVATQPIVTNMTEHGKQIENIGFWVDTKIGKANPVTNIKDSQKILKQVQDDTDKKGMLRQAQHDKGIYGLSGTCLLIRKNVFEKVGMWDESFHSYLEDVDLAIRLQKGKYKVAPCLDAEVTHEHMATSGKMGLYKEMQDVKNWWRLMLKHPDVFVRLNTIFPLLVERGRNLSGLVKKALRV